jgi:hypothetical protein
MKLTVIIRDITPAVHLGEPVDHRSIQVELTDAQARSLALRHPKEEFSLCILEGTPYLESAAAPSAPLIPQSRAEEGNEGTNGKSFAVDVLGHPMCEVSPGKWENYLPRSRAEEMVAEEREEIAKVAEAFMFSESKDSREDLDRLAAFSNGTVRRIAAAIRARKTEAPAPSPERQKKEPAK